MNGNKYLKKSLIRFIIIYIFLMSFARTFMKIDYNNWNKFLDKQKFEDVDTKSFEYVIDRHNLKSIYEKIKKEDFDKLDDVDKMIVKDYLRYYNNYGDYNLINIKDKINIDINDWLKFDKKTLENYFNDVEPEYVYFTSFYKVVIDGDKNFAKYINKDLDENIINNIKTNKRSNNAVLKFVESDNFKGGKDYKREIYSSNTRVNRKEEYQDIFKRAYKDRITGVIFLSIFIIIFGIVMFVFLASVIGVVLDEVSEKNNTL